MICYSLNAESQRTQRLAKKVLLDGITSTSVVLTIFILFTIVALLASYVPARRA
jgi:hypothetical protein